MPTDPADRPGFIPEVSLVELYAQGLLPTAPDDLTEVGFGPVEAPDAPAAMEPVDPLDAFVEAWGTAGFRPDAPLPRRRR